MTSLAPEDIAQAHKFFSADCFNRTWTLIEKPDRTPAEIEQMLLLSLASMWHWTQRTDCTDLNRSIGYWQLARVYALAGQAGNARRYGELCLRYSQDQPPFYMAYAHEALARAALVGNDRVGMSMHLADARRLAEQVTDAEDRGLLIKDLESLQ